MGTNGTPQRMRADARGNRQRILQAARTAFADHGSRASLNKVAQHAGVGPGTLYRHFPSLQALLAAIIGDDVAALCRSGHELMNHPSPDEALYTWLHAVAVHATAMRGLVATHMAAEPAPGTGTGLAACHESIRATGAALLTRAQQQGTVPRDTRIEDLLKLANAVAWASEQAPADKGLLDRLLALTAHSQHAQATAARLQRSERPASTGARPVRERARTRNESQ
jgi:AcrR family transcriptional regulator